MSVSRPAIRNSCQEANIYRLENTVKLGGKKNIVPLPSRLIAFEFLEVPWLGHHKRGSVLVRIFHAQMHVGNQALLQVFHRIAGLLQNPLQQQRKP